MVRVYKKDASRKYEKNKTEKCDSSHFTRQSRFASLLVCFYLDTSDNTTLFRKNGSNFLVLFFVFGQIRCYILPNK